MSLSKLKTWFENWKPIHLCWWFKKHGWKVPRYLIGTDNPVIYQTNFIFGDDNDGSTDPDDAGDWDTESTDRTGQAKNTPFFIRIQVAEQNNDGGVNDYFQLFIGTTDVAADAVQVTTSEASGEVCKIVDDGGSNNVADYSATTDNTIMTGTGQTWQNGQYMDTSDDSDKYNIVQNQYTEFQWCIQFTANAGDETDYYFFVRRLDLVLNDYLDIPKCTTAAAAADLTADVNNPVVASDSTTARITPYTTTEYEPVVPSDVITVALDNLRTDVSETTVPSDAITADLTPLKASVYDLSVPSDSTTQEVGGAADLEATPYETIVASAAITTRLDLGVIVSDSIVPSDAVSKQLDLVESTSETIVPSDSVTAVLDVGIYTSDPVVPSDNVTARLNPYTVTAYEPVVPSDSVTVVLDLGTIVYESIVPSDSVTARRSHLETSVYDNIVPSDSVTGRLGLFRIHTYETVVASDSPTNRLSTLKVSVSDTLAVRPARRALVLEPALTASVYDPVVAATAITCGCGLLICSVSDTVVVSDSQTVERESMKYMAEGYAE